MYHEHRAAHGAMGRCFRGSRTPKERYDTGIGRQDRRAKAQNRYLPSLQTGDSTPSCGNRRRVLMDLLTEGQDARPLLCAGQPPASGPDPGRGGKAHRHQAHGPPPP